MPTAIEVEVKGLEELQKKKEQMVKDLHGTPMLAAMRNATMLVTRDAKVLAPVDTGRLRASITPDVQLEDKTDVVGVVGSNLTYAPYMELGTGIPAGNPKVHWPPASALETWAKRHGTTGFLVARAIGLRGGLKPRRFLQKAFEQNQERIVEFIGTAVTKIVRK